MHNLQALADAGSPVAKSVLVGSVSTVGAAIQDDWRILAIGAAVQLGMAAITAFAARPRSKSRRTRAKKTKQPTT